MTENEKAESRHMKAVDVAVEEIKSNFIISVGVMFAGIGILMVSPGLQESVILFSIFWLGCAFIFFAAIAGQQAFKSIIHKLQDEKTIAITLDEWFKTCSKAQSIFLALGAICKMIAILGVILLNFQ